MSSCQVWYISWVPKVLGSWGRSFSLGVCCVMSCYGDAMLPDPWFPFFSSFVHQLLSNSDHSLNKSIRSGMSWAAGVVCDVVSLQKLLELLGIVAWAISTPDNVG